MRITKPGPGWKRLGGAVYEHTSGNRIHVMGLLRTPAGEMINGMQWPESQVLTRFVRMAGGNHRRGVMAWAKSIVSHAPPESEATDGK